MGEAQIAIRALAIGGDRFAQRGRRSRRRRSGGLGRTEGRNPVPPRSPLWHPPNCGYGALVTAMPGAITTAAAVGAIQPRSMRRDAGGYRRPRSRARRIARAGTPDEVAQPARTDRTPEGYGARTVSRHPSHRAGSWPELRWRPPARGHAASAFAAADHPASPGSPLKFCSTTSVEYFSAPSLSVHLRVWSEPSR